MYDLLVFYLAARKKNHDFDQIFTLSDQTQSLPFVVIQNHCEFLVLNYTNV
jgi:hypothetical protein